MQKTLEQAYLDREQADRDASNVQGRIDAAQQQLADQNQVLSDLNKAMAGARQKQQQANQNLLVVAGQVPRENVAHIPDGHELLVVDGNVRILTPVEASTISADVPDLSDQGGTGGGGTGGGTEPGPGTGTGGGTGTDTGSGTGTGTGTDGTGGTTDTGAGGADQTGTAGQVQPGAGADTGSAAAPAQLDQTGPEQAAPHQFDPAGTAERVPGLIVQD